MDYTARVENLMTMIEDNRILRGNWGMQDDEGRQYACLLGALAPETVKAESAQACPADVMPRWLAYLTPLMDDMGSDIYWPTMVRKYADLASRWHVLDEHAWRRVEMKARIALTWAFQSFSKNGGVRMYAEQIRHLYMRMEGQYKPLPWEWNKLVKNSDRNSYILLRYNDLEMGIIDGLATLVTSDYDPTTTIVAIEQLEGTAMESSSVAARNEKDMNMDTYIKMVTGIWDRLTDRVFDAITREIKEAEQKAPAA